MLSFEFFEMRQKLLKFLSSNSLWYFIVEIILGLIRLFGEELPEEYHLIENAAQRPESAILVKKDSNWRLKAA